MKKEKQEIWKKPFLETKIQTENVKTKEIIFGYFIGPFGALLSSGIFTGILQNYFTDVLKMDLTFLSTLQLVSTVFIVMANLIVGQLIEHTLTPAGKVRPWILLSAFTLSTASVLMFIVPLDGKGKMIWIAISYNLFYSIAYPIYNTANSALIPLSTRDSEERGVLASVTNIAGLGVMGAGSMVFPMLASFLLKENQHLWFGAMLAVAIFACITILLQYQYTRERVTEEKTQYNSEKGTPQNVRNSLKKQLKAVTGEKTWWLVMVFYMLFQWSGALKNTSMSYYCKWVLDNSFFQSSDAWGASQSLLSVLGAIPMAVAALVVVPLCNKYGKRIVCMLGMVIGTAGGCIAMAGNGKIIPVAIGVACKCLGSAPACYMILALFSDVIDHIEYKSHIRTDGLTMSVYSSIMVAGTPVCNAVFSGLLKASEYDQQAEIIMGIVGQNQSVRNLISISYIGVETISYMICAILIFFFTIEKTLPEEQREIRKRK